MKKGLVFSLIISIILFLGLSIFALIPKNNFSTDKVAQFRQFEQAVKAELQKDNYSYTEIDKTVTLTQLKQQLEPNSANNHVTNFSLEDNKILTKNQFADYCQANDLIMEETETSYKVIHKYALKRIIIFGVLPNNHNASKVFSFDDLHILFYPSVEETKLAYQNLKANNSDAIVDFIVSTQSNNYDLHLKYVKDNNWSDERINLSAYTNYSTSKEVIVAVLDTGINSQHPLFAVNETADRLLKDASGNIVGTSYETTTYTFSGEEFEDDDGHGTHVAGIITSQTPSNVKILPIKVLNHEGKGDFSNVILALEKIYTDYASTYNNIVCANLSLGGSPSDFESNKTSFNDWFKKLKSDKNILSVVAAGNDSVNTSTVLPAACESPIVVSALKETTNASSHYMAFDDSYSNFGSTVDISAPGTSIVSAFKASDKNGSTIDQYASAKGTSQAAPHVSAAIANLALHKDKTYTADEIESRILNAAIDLDHNGEDEQLGKGALTYASFNNVLANIQHSVSSKTFTYDGNYHNIAVNVTNPTSGYSIKYSLEDDNTYTITNISTNTAFKNANGSGITIYYQISATGYATITGSAVLRINRRQLSYTLKDQSSTYGNSQHIYQNSNTLVLNSGSIVSGDNLNINLSTPATQFSNVGDYNITLTHANNNNYSISYNTAKLTISARPLIISILDQSSTYGGSFAFDSSKYTISGLAGSDTLSNFAITTTATQSSNAGTYPITATYTANNNYSVTVDEGTFTINKKSATITIGNTTSTYGNTIDLSSVTYSVTGLISGDEISNIELTTTATSLSDAKPYDITATYDENINYIVTIEKGTLTISPRVLIIEITNNQISNQTIEYGDDLIIDNDSYRIKNESDVLQKDKATFKMSITSSVDPNNAEDYIVSAVSQNKNYTLVLENNKIITVPRKLTVEILNQQFEYGEDIVLNQKAYSIKSGSFAHSDESTVVLSTTATKGSNVNEYDISLSFDNKNKYDLTIIPGKIGITKRAINITTNQNKIYGDEIDLNNSLFTEVLENETSRIFGNDNLDLQFTTLATKFSSIGEYEITLVSANGNYNVTLINSYLTITPKPIYVTLLPQSSIYGDNVELDNSKLEFDNSQLLEGTTINFNLITNASALCDVGEYSIHAEIDNNNYELLPTSGILSIIKRKISIRLYDQTIPHSFQIEYNAEDYDIMSGSVISGDELNIKLHTNATSFSFAGDYDISATYLNSNYDITFTEATLTLEFSYIDALMILIPAVVLILVATIILVIVIKRKNRDIPLFKKWNK